MYFEMSLERRTFITTKTKFLCRSDLCTSLSVDQLVWLFKMCIVCNQLWKIVDQERRIQGFGFEPFLQRIVEKFENFNEQNQSKVSVFTILQDELFIGIATENYTAQLNSLQWELPNTCGGLTVVDTKGQLIRWEERTIRGIFIDPDWEEWIQVVWAWLQLCSLPPEAPPSRVSAVIDTLDIWHLS